MLIGYARTSTVDQQAGFLAQKRDLENAGVEKLYTEQVSSVGTRVQLDAALEFARDGDTLIVTKLDRLARSTVHLLTILELLERKGVALRILDFGGGAVDTHSPTGKLMLTMFGAMAQFEREMMLERQREGIAKAKQEGKYKGRKPTARAKVEQVREMHANGRKPIEIARELGMGRASVYRLLTSSDGSDSGNFSYSEIAAVTGILNMPDDLDLAIETGIMLCGEILEPLMKEFGPVVVRSGLAVNNPGCW